MWSRMAILMGAAGFVVSLAGGGAPAAVNSDPDLPKAEVAEARSGNPLWAVPLAVLHETRERPIFSASRRPPAPPVVAVAVEAPPPPPRAPPPRPDRPALVLLGTVSGEAMHFGVFHNPATTKTLRLAVGETFEGWILRAVTSTGARFDYEGQSATLELRPTAKLAMKGEAAATGERPAEADVPLVTSRRKRQR
jgi:general secretion pathway protein N